MIDKQIINYICKPKVSIILLDWSCRERFFSLYWLSKQDIQRHNYEIIWVELYNRSIPEIENNADIVIQCNQIGRYHKHKGYNAGVLASRGDIITVCDSDAVFPPNFVSSIINRFYQSKKSDIESLVLMHYERRTKSKYPDGMNNIDMLKEHHWEPLWENVGACVSAKKSDIIRFGGFDEHRSFRGYICGPYELVWRMINAGIPEEWHDPGTSLWHFDHPNDDNKHIYQKIKIETILELGFIRPHLKEHSLRAVEAFSTGRLLPLKENHEIHYSRMSSRKIGSDYEKEYSNVTKQKGFSFFKLMIIRLFHLENFILRIIKHNLPIIFRIYKKVNDIFLGKRLKALRFSSVGSVGVMCENENNYNLPGKNNRGNTGKMNILFMTDDDITKSVVYDIHLMAEGLSINGHNVIVIDCKRGKANWFKTYKERLARVYEDADVKLFRYSMMTFPIFTEKFKYFLLKYIYAHFQCYRLAKKTIQKYDIDVIVLYSVVNSGMSTLKLGKKFNLPVVFRNIDMLHRLNANSMVRSAVTFCEMMVYPRVDKILALTPKYKDYLVLMGGSNVNTKLLPFPVEITKNKEWTTSFSGELHEVYKNWLKNKKRILVFVGHLYSFSGLGEFIEQFNIIVEKVPDARLLIVGDGPIRGELEDSICDLGLREYVCITGLQPFGALRDYIKAASLCINAYPINGDMKDLFAAKVIQYLACGKATVSSALEGMTTMIPRESCGVVYVMNAKEMAHEIVKLLSFPEILEKLGEEGLKYVKNVHCREKVVKQLEKELFESIKIKRKKNFTTNPIKRWICSRRNQYYENNLYNSANMGYEFARAGQRINKLSANTVVFNVAFFMDKIGEPEGEGVCVVRKVKDDKKIGILGKVNMKELPSVPNNPKWIIFNSKEIEIEERGDYRIVFEWNNKNGDESNYPRIRYNNTDTINGFFTQYNEKSKWVDHLSSDSSIKISIISLKR